MKKSLSVVLGVVLACACVLFTACKDDDEGEKPPAYLMPTVVSEQTYTTAQDAVTGFVEQELLGGEIDDLCEWEGCQPEDLYQIKNVTSAGSVSANVLALSAAQKTGFVSAEKFTLSLSAFDGYFECTATAKVAKYNGDIYRYVVTTEVGERATRSYLEVLFDYEIYKNCELVERYYDNDSENENGQSEAGDMKLDDICATEFSESAVYEATYASEEDYRNHTPIPWQGVGNYEGDEWYFWMDGTTPFSVYRNYGTQGEWIVDTEEAFSSAHSLEDKWYEYWSFMEGGMLDMGAFEFFPAAFRITATGLTTYENAEAPAALPDAPTEDYMDDNYIGATITVENGRIVKIQSWAYELVHYLRLQNYVTTFSKFGQVSVTVPDEVKAAAAQA